MLPLPLIKYSIKPLIKYVLAAKHLCAEPGGLMRRCCRESVMHEPVAPDEINGDIIENIIIFIK